MPNTTTTPSNGTGYQHWKNKTSSSKYKEYQPRFTPTVQIPAIECFQLDYILNEVFPKESQQVSSDLLTVASNYQNDLRQDIKYNLSIEQKIQFRNIQIAKNASNLNKIFLNKKKKLTKCLMNSKNDQIDSRINEVEVNQLLKNTIEVSSKVKNLMERLTKLDKKLRGHDKDTLVATNRKVYPNLYKLMNKNESGDKGKASDDDDDDDVEEEEEVVVVPNENYFDSNHDDTVISNNQNESYNNSPRETSISLPADSPTTPVTELISTPQSLPSPIQESLATPEESQEQPVENSTNETEEVSIQDLDPDQFESFMNSSIARYRNVQNKKHSEALKKTIPGISNSASYQQPSNPLTLLYSQLISNPKYIDSQRNGQFPFSNIVTIKSTATTESTQQDSHFKKLRINGDPITSESLRRKKEKCKCTPSNGESNSSIRSAEDLLANLHIGDHDNEGEEVWTSSEFNTDDDTIDDLLSSDSSDSDSSTDGFSHISSTNQYYYNLKSDLKQKKKERLSYKRKNKRRKSINRSPKELSPTPKHIPSHRILKPKKSILKTNSNSSKRFTRENSPFRRADFVTERLDDKLSEEVSALSQVNNAYGSKTNNTITSFTAQGTILPLKEDSPEEYNAIPENQDEENPRKVSSISLLKSYVQ
ncbi:conserved hypothetical protein [Candida tropicalis MYA-3404]|uniref:Uncharacterized protein n=1 Tax=Candida tropicalis (strain ATCC MYA-3404 / T1) TaxID=294747 RepID=C5M524_CANTT|nr:conserved hypothetical protein [Candida tropicalis MYA-3404]EER35140.1 conserved hypothetical protein [Candida tropicalis MYA-3404]KAG4409028.1 hypothetical protein JTP64_002334 [Candida tropicalis]